MGKVVVAGALVVVVAAVLVPLPWTVVDTATFVPAASAAAVEIDPGFAASTGGHDATVSGEYLTLRQHPRAPLVRLLAATVNPAAEIVGPAPAPAPGAVHPLVAAAMAGLGVVPRHADPSELPVRAAVDGPVDPWAVGLALYAFDAGAQPDVAAGRRILGLGRLGEGGVLECAGPIPAAVRAAADSAVDVIVVPTGCAPAAAAALPDGATVRLVEAGVLGEVAEALR